MTQERKGLVLGLNSTKTNCWCVQEVKIWHMSLQLFRSISVLKFEALTRFALRCCRFWEYLGSVSSPVSSVYILQHVLQTAVMRFRSWSELINTLNIKHGHEFWVVTERIRSHTKLKRLRKTRPESHWTSVLKGACWSASLRMVCGHPLWFFFPARAN